MQASSAGSPGLTQGAVTAPGATRPMQTPPPAASAATGYPASATSAPYPPAGSSAAYGQQPRANGAAPAPTGPRRVRLTVSRVDPWSVLKLSFLLSVALGIGLVTASVILWEVVNGMGVFTKINELLRDVATASKIDVYEYVGLSRVVSLSTFVAVINVVIIMALSTLGAVLYNLASSLVGGLQVTLSDD